MFSVASMTSHNHGSRAHRTAKDVLAVLETLANGWANGDTSALAGVFTESSELCSSAHGEARGASDIAAVLSADFAPDSAQPFAITTTNHYVGGNDERAVLTSYLYGVSPQRGPAASVFGATLLADLVRTDVGWRIETLRLSIPWTDGDPARFHKWTLPSVEGWKLGDPTPTIVSELDSPWARGIPDLDPDDAIRQAEDFYSRYSWAIDQGDIALLSDCFTDDAFGSFPPMGDRQGRHDVIGQMKPFRRLWPWMQHFGRPLKITVDEAGTTGHLVVGRIIPQQPTTPTGRDLYGAHYQLDLRRENGTWRISRFDYIPGWISTTEE